MTTLILKLTGPNNIYNDNILERVGELLKISKTKIILDIYRQFGLDIFTKSTNWKFISSLLTTYSQKNFIFETPSDSTNTSNCKIG